MTFGVDALLYIVNLYFMLAFKQYEDCFYWFEKSEYM